MNNISIKARLVGGFALMAIALLLVSATSLWLLNQAQGNFRRHVEVVETKTTLIARFPPSEEEAKLIAHLADIEQRYGSVALAIVDIAAKGRVQEATDRMNQECMPLLDQLDETINALGALSREGSRASVARS